MSAVVPRGIEKSRQRRLYDELSSAIARTDRAAMKRWGLDSALMMGNVTTRRAKNVGTLVYRVCQSTSREVGDLYSQARQGRGLAHARRRLGNAGQSLHGAGRQVALAAKAVAVNLRDSPSEFAPKLAVSMLAFLAAGGGVDGDGGAPDLDLKVSIGAHRSILTHSILMGAAIETMLGATANLIGLVYHNLPPEHDPLWDTVAKHKDEYLALASKGASLGVAYHLLIDGTQPAAYKDLPFSASMETHQAILEGNAAVETLDVVKREGGIAKWWKDFKTEIDERMASREKQHVEGARRAVAAPCTVVRCVNCGMFLRLPRGKLLDARCPACRQTFRVQT